MAVGAGGLRIGSVFHSKNRAFALFDEPAGEHGGRVFLEPLVEQLGNFLAEIGGVGEARKFIGLQGIARGGEQKFPGSLGAEVRHEDLRKNGLEKYRRNINSRVIDETSSFRITSLWKCVEKGENLQGLCSGCAGDYEDPDRSAWEADPEEEEGDTGGGGAWEGQLPGDAGEEK
jgi:hypothetical protein